MKLLIKGGKLIDPASKREGVYDILVDGPKIAEVAKSIKKKADKTIDAKDKILMPGIIDMHVHLREPGRPDKETIVTGTQAALKGGVTTALAMPNTTPAIDSVKHIQLLKKAIKKDAKIEVLITAAMTKKREGAALTEIKKLKKEGAVCLSDDGTSLDSPKLMGNVLKKAKENKVLVSAHCEDKALSGEGSVNRGFTSTSMGLKGVSNESEYARIERDIGLAHKQNASIHIAHVSTKESVDIIRKAKKKGVKVTAETAPHYFTLSEESVWGFDTNMKMNPPLRSKQDVEAIKRGLRDGTIDAIASDHAPHTENEKDIEFNRAEFGIIGLETMLYITVQELLRKKILSWGDMVEKLSTNPAKILGIQKGSLRKGLSADIIIFDPEPEWILEKADIVSKSKNSPFIGRRFKGKIIYAVCGGIAHKI